MSNNNQTEEVCITSTQVNIVFDTRLFWRELIYWTTSYLNSVFTGIGNSAEEYAKLLDTPAGYSYMLRLILRRPVADRYRTLFGRYIIILRELVNAVLNGDTEMINEKVTELYRNSAERAEFIAGVFPSLSKDVLEDMLNTFVQLEFEEINSYVSQDYSRTVEILDNLLLHADNMADYFSQGIINLITAAPVYESNSMADSTYNQDSGICITNDELDIILRIALFWIELAGWFRAYRISLMAGTGNSELIYNRLNQHLINFGNDLKTFLDEETVDTHIMLLREYVSLMDQMLNARISNNVEEMNRIYRLTVENINARAEFLASVFPSLSADELRNRLTTIHSYFIEMAAAFLSGEYTRNIAIFEALINLAEEIGYYFIESLFAMMSVN